MYRHELLNWLIDLRGLKSYLEIGCNRDTTFRQVKAEVKTGVDPVRGGTHRMTSDAFFHRGLAFDYDLVFIDGLHHREQVLRDVDNSLAHLNPGGVIVLDDCRPKEEIQQRRGPKKGYWTGDVWKAVVELRQRPDIDTCVLDDSWGYGIVLPRPNTDPFPPISLPALPRRQAGGQAGDPLDWRLYCRRRSELLRLVDFPGLTEFLG